MKKILLLIISFLLCLSACSTDTNNTSSEEASKEVSQMNNSEESSPIGEESSEQSDEEPSEQSEEHSEEIVYDDDGFEPVIRFAVASDIHMSLANSVQGERLKKLFSTSYDYSSENEFYSVLDALVMVGDMTNLGLTSEYTQLKKVINENIKDETQLITVMGNHEFYGGGEAAYLNSMDDSLNKHIVINGYHFIAISPQDDKTYKPETLNWLKAELKSAAEADPEKPIFVFQHHHIQNTVYVSSEWYTTDSGTLGAILKEYPQVIDFSGHSHGPINNPTSIWQGKFTCLGTGTLSYFEMTSGMTVGTVPENSSNAAQYYIIEVDAANKVKIQPFNILTGSFFKEPSGSGKQLVYYVDIPLGEKGFRYTNTSRSKASEAPYFDGSAVIEAENITKQSVDIIIPQAHDDDCVYSYEVTAEYASGKQNFAYFAEYYFEPMPEHQTLKLTGLKANTDYTIKIVPVDCWGKKGDAISTRIHTLANEDIVYKSENPVNYSGTFSNFDSLTKLTVSNNTVAYGGKADGDVFVGNWSDSGTSEASHAELESGKGYNGSASLAVWSDSTENQGLYIFATSENKNTTRFPEVNYLRVWMDLTDVGFRKANFGLVAPTGGLFTTDEEDGRDDQYFWYLADGSEKWVKMVHGDDGCFGDAQNSSVKGLKGWFAFPVSDFVYRYGTGSVSEGGISFHYDEVNGIYMFWDYSDSYYCTGKKFYIDELHIVGDYTAFEE